MNISFRITIVLIMLFAIIAPRCHGAVLLDDFAGLRKSVNQGPIWAPDPSRIFATPGGGGHPEGVAVSMPAPVAAKTSKPKPEAKPDEKPTPPSIPTVKPPKDEPVKPECKPHKCWPFKFRAPKAKPACKHAHDKPACKPDHLGATPSNLGKGLCGKFGGHKMSGHSKGKCGRGGHGKGRR